MLDQIFRRLQMVIGRARVNTTNDAGAVQYAQISYSRIETKDNVPRLIEYGLSSNPPQDSDAIALHLSGDRSNGVIVATGHQPSRPKGLAVGESMLYQQNGIQLYLGNAGLVINAAGLPVTCNDATNFTVNCSGVFRVVAPGGVQFVSPSLTNTGDIQDNAATNPKTMAVMRADYDEHGHPVVGVQTGSSTIVSGTPTVPM